MGEILASNFLPKLSPKPHPRKPKQKTPSLEAMQTSASTVGKGGGFITHLKRIASLCAAVACDSPPHFSKVVEVAAAVAIVANKEQIIISSK